MCAVAIGARVAERCARFVHLLHGSVRRAINRPAAGRRSAAVASKTVGSRNPAVPAFIGLAPDAGHPPYGSPGLPGFLGVGHAAFRPSGPAKKNMVLNGIDASRLDDRKSLFRSLDTLRRDVDAGGNIKGARLDQPAGVRHPHVEPSGRGAGRFPGTAIGSRSLWQRKSHADTATELPGISNTSFSRAVLLKQALAW